MNEVDRDLGLVLLKRLWQRGLISEETHVSACNSRFFDKKRFTPYAETVKANYVEEDRKHDDN